MSDVADDDVDAEADAQIRACLNPAAPRSFFLFAGAGSGKTRSLVGALRNVRQHYGGWLAAHDKRVGVITYTNAAASEIRERLGFDPRVEVATIHAFAWSLVRGFDHDIGGWLDAKLGTDLAELEEEHARIKPSKSAAFEKRERQLVAWRERRDSLPAIRRFVYSPTGSNRERESLNHAEVLALVAALLREKATLRQLLVTAYPILLIDESQDTNATLLAALVDVQRQHPERFSLGLFGDMMQRIYFDGPKRFSIPSGWLTPIKKMNHRCPPRVVKLINAIRQEDDANQQQARGDRDDGIVRLFIASADGVEPGAVERQAMHAMAEESGDARWQVTDLVKVLILEHRMAARRMGFAGLYEPLARVESLRSELARGDLPGLTFFSREVLPIVEALRTGNRFALAAAVKLRSPLLDAARLEAYGADPSALLTIANGACDALGKAFENDLAPSLGAVLTLVARTELLAIPDSLIGFVDHESAGEDDVSDPLAAAWREALQAPFDELVVYHRYIRGELSFDTHQGVKGREFERVMVVISDAEARGFNFSYEKLFGAKEPSAADRKHAAAGEEDIYMRTRRLLYVACSRAKKSLALVCYSGDPSAVSRTAVERGWIDEAEVRLLG